MPLYKIRSSTSSPAFILSCCCSVSLHVFPFPPPRPTPSPSRPKPATPQINQTLRPTSTLNMNRLKSIISRPSSHPTPSATVKTPGSHAPARSYQVLSHPLLLLFFFPRGRMVGALGFFFDALKIPHRFLFFLKTQLSSSCLLLFIVSLRTPSHYNSHPRSPLPSPPAPPFTLLVLLCYMLTLHTFTS